MFLFDFKINCKDKTLTALDDTKHGLALQFNGPANQTSIQNSL